MNQKFPRNGSNVPSQAHQVLLPNPFKQQQNDEGGLEREARYGDSTRKKRKFPNWLGVTVVHKKKRGG